MSSHVPSDPLIGTTVSQFEVVSKLGGGGMGVVYKARDLKLGRLVALKFLPPQWSHDEGAKQRFIREAQAASATQHRNICTIHNIETAPDGRLFIVMACYEGETLKQRLERGALPIGDAVQIGLEIAEGLAKAHAQGVVHRDIKPGNIILTDDGVKIVDFGLAKFADALQLTVPGTTIGTVAYMSPEQTRGEEADAQSDVWAWGIVMYAMLTGAPPFRGPYPEATFYAIKNETLPSLRNARPDIPEALEQIVTPALEKDRALRYASAREPARALRLLQGMTLPLDLRTQSVAVPAALRGDAAARRRVITPLRALLTIVIAVVAAGSWWIWAHRPVTRVAVAVVPVANHTGVPDLDRYRMALSAALTQEFEESPNIRVVPYLRLLETIRPFTLRGGDVSSSQAVQAIAAGSGASFLVVPTLIYRDAAWLMQVQVRNTVTGTTVASYETAPITSSLSQQTAFRLTATAADQVQTHFREHGPGRAFSARPESRRIRDREAARLFEQGLDAYEVMEYQAAADAFGGSAAADDQHAVTHAWLARTLALLGRKSEATTAARRAKALAGAGEGDFAAAFIDAVLAENSGDPAAGDAAYRRLVDRATDQALARVELADYLKRRQDRNVQAIETYHAALGMDATYLRIHVDLCQLYTRLDDYPLADKEGLTALNGARGAGNPSVEAQALLCLAEAQRKSGRDVAQGRQMSAEARRLIEPLRQPYNLARAVFYQALMEFSDHQLVAAGDLFKEAAERLNQAGNKTMEATSLMNLGLTRHFSGRPTEALAIYARSDDAFRDIGDERRAAEMEVNWSGLQVEYGPETDEVRRRLRNAKSNLEQMGHIDFQLGATQIEAEIEGYAGRQQQSRQMLRAAWAAARDKKLSVRINSLGVAIIDAALAAGDYAEALSVAQSTEITSPELPLRLAVTLTGLGEIRGGETAMARAQTALAASDNMSVRLMLEVARGKLAAERGDAAGAREHFARTIGLWKDVLVPASVAEAHCSLAEVEAEAGTLCAGTARRRSGRPRGGAVVAPCADRALPSRRCAGRILARNYRAALSSLSAIPDDEDARTTGLPLRVSVEYWRARALRGLNAPDAAAQDEKVRRLLDTLQESVPSDYRQRFVARRSIHEMFGASGS